MSTDYMRNSYVISYHRDAVPLCDVADINALKCCCQKSVFHFYVPSTTFGCLLEILLVVITRVTLGLGGTVFQALCSLYHMTIL